MTFELLLSAHKLHSQRRELIIKLDKLRRERAVAREENRPETSPWLAKRKACANTAAADVGWHFMMMILFFFAWWAVRGHPAFFCVVLDNTRTYPKTTV